jgi:hypothetical protein
MATSITFFPVDNGDMTLISLGDKAGTTILIDCNIRGAADDPNHETRDVATDLRERLKRDSNGRPYVDVFLLSHPDQDHCRGIQNHFYLGSPGKYGDDKKPDSEKRILISEMWSSPIVFRRTSADHKLCEDAVAFKKEAKRRVAIAREKDCSGIDSGDRVLILGEDQDGKTDDILDIVVKLDADITKVNGSESKIFKGRLLAPLPYTDDAEEDMLRKNHSSVILNMELAEDETRKTVKNFLSGGDAEVLIWEKLWAKYKKSPETLSYDVMQTPHHCSWHSISNDSRSELGDKAKVSPDAKSALSQIREGGRIIASSCPIEDNDCDPPSHAAKKEYEGIAKGVKGQFLCTGAYPEIGKAAPMEFTISGQKVNESVRKAAVEPAKAVDRGLIDQIRRKAAEAEAVSKGGERRYA